MFTVHLHTKPSQPDWEVNTIKTPSQMRKLRHGKVKNFAQEPMAIKGQILDADPELSEPRPGCCPRSLLSTKWAPARCALGDGQLRRAGGCQTFSCPYEEQDWRPQRHCHPGESNGKGGKEARGASGREVVPDVKEISLCSYQELDSALRYIFWRGLSRWASGNRELNCGREKDTRLMAVFFMFSVPTWLCWAGLQSADFFRETGQWRGRRRALPEGISIYNRGGLASPDDTGPASEIETLGELCSKAICWQNFCFFKGRTLIFFSSSFQLIR